MCPKKTVRNRGTREKFHRVSGSIYMTVADTAAPLPAVIRVTPLFGAAQGTRTAAQGASKLASLSDLFQYYRCTRLGVRWVRMDAGTEHLIGFAGNFPINLPASFDDVAALPWTSEMLTGVVATSQVVPSVPKMQYIPPSVLGSGIIPWYKFGASSGSVDDQLEYQGILAIYNGAVASGSSTFQLDYTFEFKDFIGSATTPALRKPPTASVPQIVGPSGLKVAARLPLDDDDAKSWYAADADQALTRPGHQSLSRTDQSLSRADQVALTRLLESRGYKVDPG